MPGTVSRLDEVKAQPRSWSQLSQHTDCGYAYKLDRIDRVWSQPASWYGMGTGAHHAIELWEKSNRTATLEQAQDWFREEYVKEINEELAETPNLAFWAASGPYKGEADAVRRYRVGLEHVERYLGYYTNKHPEEVIWITPEGEPAIELNFDVDLDGVRVRGKIDAIIDHPKKGLIIVDEKTGANPGTGEQLKVYAQAVWEMFKVEVKWGAYFMSKRGSPTRLKDLTLVSRDEVVTRFRDMDAKVKAEEFTPNPGPNCARCSVRDSCEYREDED